VPLQEVSPFVAEIKTAAAKAGRDPGALHIVSRGSFQLHANPRGKDRRPLWGNLEEIREDIGTLCRGGTDRALLEANFDPRGVSLERTLEVMEAMAPR